ncbi:MAG TPA: MBL fold metallo-hydrolase [Cyclobacteriaceae bacterium]|nr:MBL fold metallo-hydrolase [Cyclobacteriaceae bacterium]
MKLTVINTGFFKLDGGAMFGVVPKSIWNKLNPADEKNLCTWAMRCLLVEDGDRCILIDNGIGDKQDARFLSFYYLHGDDTLIGSLNAAGYTANDVTDMFLTHLHFDHCGGGVYLDNGKPALTFPNAVYWSNEDHWQWATVPNAREKASFLKENILPMQDSGQLRFVDVGGVSPFESFDIYYASGHTDKMMLPMIRYKDKVICFVSDLIPSVGHIPLPYLMAYDTRPLIALEEKERFLKEAADRRYVLFFEHDPQFECCTVRHTEKGVRLDRTFSLSEIL